MIVNFLDGGVLRLIFVGQAADLVLEAGVFFLYGEQLLLL